MVVWGKELVALQCFWTAAGGGGSCFPRTLPDTVTSLQVRETVQSL